MRYYHIKRKPEEFTEVVGDTIISGKENKNMWISIKSAIASGIITAVLAGFIYIVGVGDIFAIDLHSLTNVIVLALLTTFVSLVKAGLTRTDGTIGGVQVK